MSTLHVTLERDSGQVARAIAAAASGPMLVVLTARMLSALADELGGMDDAAAHLVDVATASGRPIVVNVSTPSGSSSAFISPKGWSDERLAGWAAGRREELEALFGPATPGVRTWN